MYVNCFRMRLATYKFFSLGLTKKTEFHIDIDHSLLIHELIKSQYHLHIIGKLIAKQWKWRGNFYAYNFFEQVNCEYLQLHSAIYKHMSTKDNT